MLVLAVETSFSLGDHLLHCLIYSLFDSLLSSQVTLTVANTLILDHHVAITCFPASL
jgi:hypothetical protein